MARPVQFAKGPVRGWVQFNACGWGVSFAFMVMPFFLAAPRLCFDLLLIHWRVHGHVWVQGEGE